jgi:hypothetical protein
MPRNMPDPKKLAQEVVAFNRRFAVGDEVDYYEVIGLGESRRLRTRTAAEVLSGHTAVVWLDGKSGCVCCSHCFMPPGTNA